MEDENVISEVTEEEEEQGGRILAKVSRRLSSLSGVRRQTSVSGPITQSLRRATSWILGRRDSNTPMDVPSKRISNGSLPPVLESNAQGQLKKLMSVRCGGASMRGYKHRVNEDTLCIEANLVNGVQETGIESVGFAAVFDGHAGQGCSGYLQTALSACVKRLLEADVARNGNSVDGIEWRRLSKQILSSAFGTVDEEFLRLALARGDPSGSCAVVSLVKGSSVVVAHVGDCAVILIERSGTPSAIRLTRDHNARNSGEVKRVTSCGGTLINERLGGKLQPLRAFGDIEFKSSGLTAEPDLLEQVMTTTNCLLLCSDGITGHMTDQEIADFVSNTLSQEDDDPARAASALVLHTSKAKHGLDDASAVLMVFDEVQK